MGSPLGLTRRRRRCVSRQQHHSNGPSRPNGQTGLPSVTRAPGALEPMRQCLCRVIQGHGDTLRVEAGHAEWTAFPSDCLRDNGRGSLIRFGIRNDYSPKTRSSVQAWSDRDPPTRYRLQHDAAPVASRGSARGAAFLEGDVAALDFLVEGGEGDFE